MVRLTESLKDEEHFGAGKNVVEVATVARARAHYLLTKVELMNKRGNEGLAIVLARQILNKDLAPHLREREIETLAHLCHEIGSERIRSSAYADAAQWFRIAHDALCVDESGFEKKQKKKLRAAILRSLASALYYLGEETNMAMAENCADHAIELEPILPIYVLKLKILHRLSTQENPVVSKDEASRRAESAAKEALERCPLSTNEDSNGLLSLVHSSFKLMPSSTALSLLDRAVTRAIAFAGLGGSETVDRMVCAKLQICETIGMGEEIAKAIGSTLRGTTLTVQGRSATLMVLCTAGDKCLTQNLFAKAAEWYELAQTLAGSGTVGSSEDRKTAATLQRKLALAYQRTKRFSMARVAAARAQELEPGAATNYLIMLELCLDMKLSEEAIQLVKQVAATAFADPNAKAELLVAMANISYTRNDKRLLSAILETMMDACEVPSTMITTEASLALYRCMIRLGKQTQGEKDDGSKGGKSVEMLQRQLRYIERACSMLNSAGVQAVPAADVSWFRRTVM
ncbi:hypothetical protein M427DRAFT_255109 [Gonapodya prolifera JEL478]|uniref:Protein ZIP4 homolog n=1 Tax=Gonapodya prolifera (strain JEL478) TaxID=1344416 RepID=A0A139AMD3_GONPJ|nr:hypothetical protein M427DRAFT_255109 [Gonapodya prolifera JEL478]|eukprot:KXS17605.1 hypothetical protein M427DRAFT_255109 [Gonapodya prolifera JEL478]